MSLPQSFSFVQLSDPHLTSLESVRWQQLLSKRVLGYLSWLRKRRFEHRKEVLEKLCADIRRRQPGHIVVTGDLTHISLPAEFDEARRWLDSVGDPLDVSVIPGNHDAYVQVSSAAGLSQWAPFMSSDAGVPCGESTDGTESPAFPSLRVRGPVAFIGLSSAEPKPPLLATGSLGQRQCEIFSRQLAWAREQGLCRVVLIHHPPVPGLEKWRKRLTDAPQFSDIIAREGAELILHGHCHRPIESHLSGPANSQVPVVGVPSASSVHPHPQRISQYYLYRVEQQQDRWAITVTIYAYSLQSGEYSESRSLSYSLPRAG